MPDFMINALTGIVLTAAVAAVIGTYIVTRRMLFISGGITHACFGGLGLGYFLGVSPAAAAAIFAAGSSLGADWLSRRRVRRDSAIAVVWAFGMALGILFVFLTPGYVPELNSFLFGNVLTVTPADNAALLILLAALAAFWTLFRRRIVAVSFDEDFARTRGLPVAFVNTAMTLFTALAIVLSIRMMGIMLLMSFLSLPQMAAETLTRRYTPLMLLSFLFALAGGLGGDSHHPHGPLPPRRPRRRDPLQNTGTYVEAYASAFTCDKKRDCVIIKIYDTVSYVIRP